MVLDEQVTEQTSPIIKLVDSLILNAFEWRASDIHIGTKDGEVVLKYRVDGVLYSAMEPLDPVHSSTIISRVKVMAGLDVAEKRVPQDGRFKMRVRGRTIEFRVSIMPGIFGEDAVIRLLDKESISEVQPQEVLFEESGLDPTTYRDRRSTK